MARFLLLTVAICAVACVSGAPADGPAASVGQGPPGFPAFPGGQSPPQNCADAEKFCNSQKENPQGKPITENEYSKPLVSQWNCKQWADYCGFGSTTTQSSASF